MAPGRGVEALASFEAREPWVEDQIASRYIGMAKAFPGYTLPVIHELEYELWVMLALAYDEYIEEKKKERARWSRR